MSGEPIRDAAWFDALCKEHGERIIKMLGRKLNGDMHTARDLAQETLITAWKKPTDVPDAPIAWLFTTAKNHLLNHQRASRRREHDIYDEAHMAPQQPADAFLDAADLDLGGRLDALTPTEREVLELFYHDELDCNEIAEHLDINPAAARKRLSRARESALKLLTSPSSDKEDRR